MCESVLKFADEKAEKAAKKATEKTAETTKIKLFLNAINMGLGVEQARQIAEISDELVEKALKMRN